MSPTSCGLHRKDSRVRAAAIEAAVGEAAGVPEEAEKNAIRPPRLIPISRQCERRRANRSPSFFQTEAAFQNRVFVDEYDIHLAERDGL